MTGLSDPCDVLSLWAGFLLINTNVSLSPSSSTSLFTSTLPFIRAPYWLLISRFSSLHINFSVHSTSAHISISMCWMVIDSCIKIKSSTGNVYLFQLVFNGLIVGSSLDSALKRAISRNIPARNGSASVQAHTVSRAIPSAQAISTLVRRGETSSDIFNWLS